MKDGEGFRSSAGGAGAAGGEAGEGGAGEDDDGWLRTGGLASSQPLKARQVRTVDEAGNAEKDDLEDDDIPDMEDEDDDEAIIRDAGADSGDR